MTITSLGITPQFRPHASLEQRFKEYLEQNNFYVDQMTYHEKMPKVIASMLRFRKDPTALYLRGRADRIAIHNHLDLTFEWEVKTHASRKYKDLTIEALPLIHHVSKSRHGVECVYVIEDADGCDRGFRVVDMPIVREAFIPERWNDEQTEWFKERIVDIFPYLAHGRIHTGTRSGGSGDPYIVIDQKAVAGLPTWQAVVDSLIRRARRAL